MTKFLFPTINTLYYSFEYKVKNLKERNKIGNTETRFEPLSNYLASKKGALMNIKII